MLTCINVNRSSAEFRSNILFQPDFRPNFVFGLNHIRLIPSYDSFFPGTCSLLELYHAVVKYHFPESCDSDVHLPIHIHIIKI